MFWVWIRIRIYIDHQTVSVLFSPYILTQRWRRRILLRHTGCPAAAIHRAPGSGYLLAVDVPFRVFTASRYSDPAAYYSSHITLDEKLGTKKQHSARSDFFCTSCEPSYYVVDLNLSCQGITYVSQMQSYCIFIFILIFMILCFYPVFGTGLFYR